MARIPEADIERLKSEIAVERLVTASGIALRKSGKDQIGQCPFHDDAEPSLVVTASKNLWHCFGCQTGGGPIDWVMKIHGVSFRHAVELLKADLSLAAGAAAGAATPVKRSAVRALPAPVAADADDRALLAQVVGYYLYCVNNYGMLPTSSYIQGDWSWEADWKRALSATPKR